MKVQLRWLCGLALLAGCAGGSGVEGEAVAMRSDTFAMTSTTTGLERPHGIFVLDSFAGTYRDANIRSYDFVDGYVWRFGWSSLESATQPGVYDFAPLDHIMAKLAEHQLKLSWIVLPGPPQYVTTGGEAQTWVHAAAPGAQPSSMSETKPLPWDQYTLDRYQQFLQAASDHQLPDPNHGGQLVRLAEHSLFYALNICLPGTPNCAIRDKNVSIVDIPGFTRALFVEKAVIENLSNARSAFPSTHLSLGFWSSNLKDDAEVGQLWESTRDRMLQVFDGVAKRQVGVFLDNLAAKRSCASCTPVTGSPTTSYAAALDSMKDSTFTAFQALTSWKTPSTQPTGPGTTQADMVKHATPMDGIEYAYDKLGTRYFELYASDVDASEWQAGLSDWATTLRRSDSTQMP